LNRIVAALLSSGTLYQTIRKGSAAMYSETFFGENNIQRMFVKKKKSTFFDKRNYRAFPQPVSSFMLLA